MIASNDAKKNTNFLILVAALGYFVDIYDLVLFSVERIDSLTEILGVHATKDEIKNWGMILLNWQMGGMLIGGIVWGVYGDKKGRLSVLFGSILLYSIANIANGFVQNVEQYAVLRFISGFGLAGELGAGITIVSETMSKEKRGIGTMIVATVGVFGAVVAGFMGDFISNWRHSFFLGGAMGLALLVLRIGVLESKMFEQIKRSTVPKGNLLTLFKNKKNLIKYFGIILIAVPVWYVMAILITFSPEMMKALNVDSFTPEPGKAIMYAYLGITLGDFLSGMLSQVLKSRKKVLLLFLSLTVISVGLYFTLATRSEFMFYVIVTIIGVATGYWAVFMSTAAELFGTNIRSTVATTAPNFVRGAVIVLVLGFKGLENYTTTINAAIIIGLITFVLAYLSLWKLEETFHKDLDYVEQ